MKTPFRIPLALALASSLFAKTSAAGPLMKPGLWEITTRIDMPGMPTAIPPRTRTQCYTKRDVEDMKKIAPNTGRQDENCKAKDHKVTGNKVTWSIECEGKRKGSATGEIVYKGDSYEGTMTMTTVDPRRGQRQMTEHITGKRVGDCK